MTDERTVIDKNGIQQKWTDPRPHLIYLFNQRYFKETGRQNPFPYGACMNAMLTFEGVDKKTGELFVEYPEEQIWIEQVDGFFKDEFARNNRGFHFTYLLKQFGSFVKYKQVSPSRQKIEKPKPEIPRYCDICEHNGRETLIKPKEVCPVCYPACKECNIQHVVEQSCEDAKKNEERLRRMLNPNNKRTGRIKSFGEFL